MNLTQVVLGIDIGGTNTVFGLIDEEGKCYLKGTISTTLYRSADSLFSNLFKIFNSKYELIRNKYELIGIGIGAPSANYKTGSLEYPSNLNWGKVDIYSVVGQYSDLPVVIENDANAAAIGELKYGAAKDFKNFIEITLGTGLGSGIVLDGNIVYGFEGLAGEIGHTIILENGRNCSCGRKGCLETYSSANGIKRTVFELLSQHTNESILREYSFNELNSKLIFDAAISGDKIAKIAFEKTGAILGKAMANSVAHFNPEAIVLFGGLALSGDLILVPFKEHLEKNLLFMYKDRIKIVQSELNNSGNAAILGAAAISWHTIKNRQINFDNNYKTI